MIKRFLNQAWLNYKGLKAAFSLEEFICFDAMYPLISLIFYCILAGYSYNTDNLTSWVIGNSFLLCMNTCIFSLGNSFVSERYYGRIRSIIVSPVNKLSVILEKGFYPSIVSIITVVIGFIVGSLIFKVDFTHINMGLFFIITLVGMIAATGFGLFIAVFGLITDNMHFALNLISYVLMIFCGANFPIEQLPPVLKLISKILPLTRSIEAANMLFIEYDSERLLWLLIGEMGIGILYYICGFVLIRIIEKIAIKKATLEVF